MRVRRRSSLLVCAAGCLVAGTAPTVANALSVSPGPATPEATRVLPVKGASPGVVLRAQGDTIALKSRVVRRSPRGRGLRVECVDVPRTSSDGEGSTVIETPVSRRTRSVSLPEGGDWCVVSLTEARARGRRTEPVAVLSRNAIGLDALYERLAAPVMAAAADLTTGGSDGGPVDGARIVAALDGARILGRRTSAVAVPGPNTPVASGQLGVWAEGRRVSITARTPGGRAIYVTYDAADRAVSTNVLDALQDERFRTAETNRIDR